MCVLSPELSGPDAGAVFGRGWSGVILDGAARVVCDAVYTQSSNPEGDHPSPAAVQLTGALIFEGTHRTVGSFSFRLWVGLRATWLPRAVKNVLWTEKVP